MNKLSRTQVEELTEQLRLYFRDEGLEEIGNLQAEQLLHFMVQQLGPYLYNAAITDARTLLMERMQAMEDELYTLEKPLPR
ncbi:DUF2164 domain-containing protein [Ectobacillus ponti]|uniref:DUF2164 domain-containing protein n=1 Tax=Ectobacillus ponti TaxID=2961894 RepID=A0AA41XBP7_9BACI|nr:DUF2164 domain-containing protein [Ectobacillus ponti]MCP8970713.1 DUF2164 domain-containing protein [Ectobacillus ponti]